MPRVLRATQKRNFNTQPAGMILFVPFVDGMLARLFPLQPLALCNQRVRGDLVCCRHIPRYIVLLTVFALYVIQAMHCKPGAKKKKRFQYTSLKFPVPFLLTLGRFGLFFFFFFYQSMSLPRGVTVWCW